MRFGMFVTATFHGMRSEMHAMVPSTAILHLHDRDWVYLPGGGKTFRRAEVVGGITAAGQHAGGLRHQTGRPGGEGRAGARESRWSNRAEYDSRFVDFALNNRILVVAFAVLLFIWGGISFHQLPVEAYPDVANNYVEVITQWPGISAEQIEQQVTIPLEIVMNGIPHLTALRSFSLFGLSDLKMTFDDEAENDWNREKVLERLSQVTLPRRTCSRRWARTGVRSARFISSRCRAPIRVTT